MRPSSVSARWRVVRSSNDVPKCSSSAEIWRLTDVSELGSDLAAADRLPASTTRTKVAMAASWSRFYPSGFCKRDYIIEQYCRIQEGATLSKISATREFDMASMFNPTSHSRTIHRPTDSSRGADDRLTCPLAFSAAGLLANCLA